MLNEGSLYHDHSKYFAEGRLHKKNFITSYFDQYSFQISVWKISTYCIFAGSLQCPVPVHKYLWMGRRGALSTSLVSVNERKLSKMIMVSIFTLPFTMRYCQLGLILVSSWLFQSLWAMPVRVSVCQSISQSATINFSASVRKILKCFFCSYRM